MKKLLIIIPPLLILILLLAACGGNASAYNVVHMQANNFTQSSVVIHKGDMLTLVDDDGIFHDIENGTWQGNTATPGQEAGAPHVDVNINSGSMDVGPFNEAGTFQLFCTVHPGMNLTVVVQ